MWLGSIITLAVLSETRSSASLLMSQYQMGNHPRPWYFSAAAAAKSAAGGGTAAKSAAPSNRQSSSTSNSSATEKLNLEGRTLKVAFLHPISTLTTFKTNKCKVIKLNPKERFHSKMSLKVPIKYEMSYCIC